MHKPHDEFLSEEDLDLRNLSEDELIAYWNLWLEQAQITNDLDEHTYSHGVFETTPTAAPMIADIFKEIYKGQQATGRQRRERQPEVRRAEPVEEDESD